MGDDRFTDDRFVIAASSNTHQKRYSGAQVMAYRPLRDLIVAIE